jgi:hypothetical protein
MLRDAAFGVTPLTGPITSHNFNFAAYSLLMTPTFPKWSLIKASLAPWSAKSYNKA